MEIFFTMENFKQPLPESFPQLVPLENIPAKLNSVTLTNAQRQMLSQGQSVYLENMIIEQNGNTTVKDGAVQLKIQNGVANLAYTFKKTELEIDHKLLGKKLSALEEEELKQGKLVGPLKISGNEYYAQIDQKLNRVVIKTPREVGDIKEIAGVKLSPEERSKLVNLEPITGKYYQSKDNAGKTVYFAATVSLTPDRKGLEFSDIKPLSKEQYLDLTAKATKQKSQGLTI